MACEAVKAMTGAADAGSNDSLQVGLKIIFVIGAPGSGKGTLCKRLAARCGVAHRSIGDMLREAVESGSEIINDDARECVKSNNLVPGDVLASLLRAAAAEVKNQGRCTLIIDGFPRDEEQITPIESVIGEPLIVMSFDCPEKEAKRRYLNRNLPGRDAEAAVFDKRFEEYQRKNTAVVEHYAAREKLLHVDTSMETETSWGTLLEACSKQKELAGIFRDAISEVARQHGPMGS